MVKWWLLTYEVQVVVLPIVVVCQWLSSGSRVARTMARTITYLQVTMTLRQQIEPRKIMTLTLTVPTLQLQTCAKCFHFVYSQETTILPGCQW